MPYVKSAIKFELTERYAENPGELNYLLTQLLLNYIEKQGLKYQTINDIMGALESCKNEFYRRVAVEYEENKKDTNGDVYPRYLIK